MASRSSVRSIDLGDVGVALVAVGDQADLEVGGRLAAGDLVADGPDLLLGALDQAAHAAGRVEAEDDLDLRLRDGRLLVVGTGGGRQPEQGGERPPAGTACSWLFSPE